MNTTKKLDAILFDIDGTIWDTTQVVAEAWREAIRKHSDLPADFDGDTIGALFGKPMDDIFHALYPQMTDETLVKVIPNHYAYEERYFRVRKPEPYHGVRQTLAQLSDMYPLYLVTNGQKGYAETMLDATGLSSCFQGWLSYGDTYASKDVTIRRLMEMYDIRHTCYVGDTMGDMEASKKAGIPFIYCAYGLGWVKGAEYEITSMDELPAVIHTLEM